MANFKINIQGTNYEITDADRTLVNEKISHFDKFMPVSDMEEVLVEVELEKTTDHHNNGKIYRAEFNVKYKKEFKRSELVEENMQIAIELASDQLEKQIRRTKGKKTDLMRRGAAKVKSWLRFGR